MKFDFKELPILQGQSEDFLLSPKLVCAFGTKSVIVVTEDDDVFALGDDRNGYLGQIDKQNPNAPRKMEALCQKKIKSFAHFHLLHFAAINEHGQLFTWGPGNIYEGHTPKLVAGELANKKVVQVAFGLEHALTLTDQGQVFFWALNWSCDYVNRRFSKLPQRVMKGVGDRKAVAIACTFYSSHVLLEDGQLYAWGVNDYGQLGIGNCDDQCEPVRVDCLIGKTVKQISCGDCHCLALTDSGDIFGWGSNFDGRLGTRNINHWIPVLVCQSGKVVQIAATEHIISAAKLDDGTARAWDDILTCKERMIAKRFLIEFSSIDGAFVPNSMWRTIGSSLV